MAYSNPADRNAYARKWYRENAQQHRNLTAKNRQKSRVFLRKYVRDAKDKPCHDCGNRYPPYVMDFDHVGGVKLYNVSQMAPRDGSLIRIQAEIDKCEVVCANCHRVRTFNRMKTGATAEPMDDDDPQVSLFL